MILHFLASASMLAAAVINNTRLLELNMGRNRISCVGASALAKSLEVNQFLRELHLYGNHIGVQGGATLIKVAGYRQSVCFCLEIRI